MSVNLLKRFSVFVNKSKRAKLVSRQNPCGQNPPRTKSPEDKILTLVPVHWFVQPYISEVHLLVQSQIFYLHTST